MSGTPGASESASGRPAASTSDMKLEVVTIGVSDVGRATEFYRRLGWRQDVTPPGSGVVQFTPPGSACSLQFATNRTAAAPGSAQNTFLIVSDVVAPDSLESAFSARTRAYTRRGRTASRRPAERRTGLAPAPPAGGTEHATDRLESRSAQHASPAPFLARTRVNA
jgi:hypothetical protein